MEVNVIADVHLCSSTRTDSERIVFKDTVLCFNSVFPNFILRHIVNNTYTKSRSTGHFDFLVASKLSIVLFIEC